MVRPWRELAADTDAAVDDQFGEVARLVPMVKLPEYEEPSQDPDRLPVEVVGVFISSGDQVLGLAGDHAGSPLISRIAVGELFFSVTLAELGAFDPRVGDRIVLLERNNDTLEINRIPAADTGRIRLSLVQLPG